MENVKALVSYNLRHTANGDRLMMQYGRLWEAVVGVDCAETAQRWRFFGQQIPMPVRSGTWFQGFSANEMLEWLRREGWTLETKVIIGTGHATVYKKPVSDIPPLTVGKTAFEGTVCDLVQAGAKATAYFMWQYVHGGSLLQAKQAVEALVDKGN